MEGDLLDKPRTQKSLIVEHTHKCKSCGKPVTPAVPSILIVYCSYECYVND